MGLTSSLLLSATLFAAGQSPQDPEWAKIWNVLQQARAGEVSLEMVGEAVANLPDGLRSQVALHHRAVLAGDAPSPVPCPGLPKLEPGGAWAFSLAIAPGPALDNALVAAFSETPESLLGPMYQRGFTEFLAHSESAQSGPALRLAEAIHFRSKAVWSCQNLAIARTRDGDYSGGAACLDALLQGELSGPGRAQLASRLALVYLGQDGLVRARGALGGGLAVGIGDSGIVLGLLSLEADRVNRARALFRSVLARHPEQPWAGRGWGLSMVPR